MDLIQELEYDVEVRGELVILSKGTPERGETIELNNFNSSALSGTASHYYNGNENIVGWKIVGKFLKFVYDEK